VKYRNFEDELQHLQLKKMHQILYIKTNNKEEGGGEINLHQMIPITKKGGGI
jgi:hypothetical protein